MTWTWQALGEQQTGERSKDKKEGKTIQVLLCFLVSLTDFGSAGFAPFNRLMARSDTLSAVIDTIDTWYSSVPI